MLEMKCLTRTHYNEEKERNGTSKLKEKKLYV